VLLFGCLWVRRTCAGQQGSECFVPASSGRRFDRLNASTNYDANPAVREAGSRHTQDPPKKSPHKEAQLYCVHSREDRP
jgi:hypothetical protein